MRHLDAARPVARLAQAQQEPEQQVWADVETFLRNPEPILEQVRIRLDAEAQGRPAERGAPRQKRTYVKKCSWTDRVPKPLVKLVIPLTHAAEQFDVTRHTAGWLVVLDEAWHGEAILAH